MGRRPADQGGGRGRRSPRRRTRRRAGRAGAHTGCRARTRPEQHEPCRWARAEVAVAGGGTWEWPPARKLPNAAAITPSADFANSVPPFLIHGKFTPLVMVSIRKSYK